MRVSRIIFLLLLASMPFVLLAQEKEDGIVVDYNNPRKYIVGGVSVDGNHYFGDKQIIQLTGLQKGLETLREVPQGVS